MLGGGESYLNSQISFSGIPQDPKPRPSSFRAGTSDSDESLHTPDETLKPGNLTKDQNSLSHPDLSEIRKTRALTLPARGYRTGNLFRLRRRSVSCFHLNNKRNYRFSSRRGFYCNVNVSLSFQSSRDNHGWKGGNEPLR